MLDVSSKIRTLRTATARARVTLSPASLALIRDRKVPKGDPLEVAKVAAVQAAKNTSSIIPYCHPLPIEYAGVEYAFGDGWIDITTTVKTIARTGVEMEALTAAAVAALTLYDMLKMVDETMAIAGVNLLTKTGGKNDFRTTYDRPLRAAVLVMSDSIATGKKSDASGKLIAERLGKEGVTVEEYVVISDDREGIVKALLRYADEQQLDLVMTTGGTGLGPRDCTPEAMEEVAERTVPGIMEAARAYGQERTPYAMLSRATAAVRGKTLIVNLPGSRRGVAESLDALLPGLLHAFKMMGGGGHDPS